MAFDHGILNVPLGKRGNIDKQIDAYKADQARKAEAARKQRHAALFATLTEAKSLMAQVTDTRMAELGKPHGLTVKQMRAKWLSIARSNPSLVVHAMRRELENGHGQKAEV